jgi:hypothetical protein
MRDFIKFGVFRLVQMWPAISYKLATSSTDMQTHAHAFWLSFFVIVENKVVNPTPKQKVAYCSKPFRKNRIEGTYWSAQSFSILQLERSLRARFSSGEAKRAKLIEPLSDAFGPLSTFSAKIRISQVWSII